MQKLRYSLDKHSHRPILIIFGVLVFVMLFVVVHLYVFYASTVRSYSDNNDEQLQQRVTFFAHNQSELVNAKLNGIERTLITTVQLVESGAVSIDNLRGVLQGIVKVDPSIADFVVLNESGNVVTWTREATESTPTVSDRDYFQTHLSHSDSRETYLSLPSLSRIEESRPFVAMSRPLQSEGEFMGVMVLAIDLEGFSNALGAVTEIDGVTTVVSDLEGRLVLRRPFVNYQPGQVLDSIAHYQGNPPSQDQILIDSPFDGATRLVAFERLADWPWVSFVGTEREPVLSDSLAFRNDERLRLVLSLAVFLLMLGVIAWLTWQRKQAELALIDDINQRKVFEKQLAWQANHDHLTRLPNRMHFYDRAHQALGRSARYGHKFAIIFIDLDGFKQVNDQWGHAAGDELLKVIADRLLVHTRESDTVARLSGDEFVVLAEQCNEAEALHLVEKIKAVIVEPIDIIGTTLTITASLGISTAHDANTDLDILISAADASMYRDKQQNRPKSA